MSENEKVEIMEALTSLPEDKKQFVLGYAAGIAAKSDGKTEPTDRDDGKREKEST